METFQSDGEGDGDDGYQAGGGLVFDVAELKSEKENLVNTDNSEEKAEDGHQSSEDKDAEPAEDAHQSDVNKEVEEDVKISTVESEVMELNGGDKESIDQSIEIDTAVNAHSIDDINNEDDNMFVGEQDGGGEDEDQTNSVEHQTADDVLRKLDTHQETYENLTRSLQYDSLTTHKISQENASPRSQSTEESNDGDRSKSPSVQLVDGLLKAANADVSLCKYSRAVNKYEQALSMATELNDKFLIQSCACNLGAVLVIQGKAKLAIECLQQQLQKDLVRTNGMNTNALADIYYNLGLAYNANGDPSSAINCFRWAIDEFEKWKNDRGKADSHNQLAELLVKESRIDDARGDYKKAAELYSSVGDRLMQARMLVKEARMLYTLGSMDSFRKVMVACEKASTNVLQQKNMSASTKEAKLFHDMAVLYKKQSKNQEALRWLKEAWKKCRSSRTGREDIRLQAAVAQSLGRMYFLSCDFIPAIKIYQEAAALNGVIGSQRDRGWCFYYLAEAYRQLCDYPNAERSYHVAHQTLADAGEAAHLWKVSEGLGDLNASRNHPDIATTYYREALAMRSSGHSRTKSASESIIAKLTKAIHDQKASKYNLALSRKQRVPILLGYDPAVVKSPIPYTSTPAKSPESVPQVARLRPPSRRRRGKRRGSADRPVAIGVGAYDSGSDLSLFSGRLEVGVAHAYRQSGNTSQYLEVSQSYQSTMRRSVTPPDSDDDDRDEDEDEDSNDDDKSSSDSGFKNVWLRAKKLVGLGSNSEDSNLSSSSDDDAVKKKDQEEEDNDEEDEGIQSKESDKFDNTYEQPSHMVDNLLYSTVNKGALKQVQDEEPLYETLRGTKMLGGSMPTREPPPPEPPIKNHPSLKMKKTDKPSTSYDESDSFTSVTDDELEGLKETMEAGVQFTTPTMSRLTRARLEQGLYDMKKLEEEKQEHLKSIQPSSSKEQTKSKHSSRVCSIM